jgi:two-component system sensor histidine kinase KdpD
MSRDLSGALMPEQIAEISQRFAEVEFGARCAVLLADDDKRIGEPIATPAGHPSVDLGIGQWAFDHESEAGCGTDTLAGSPVIYVPLRAPMNVRGVLALEPRHSSRLLAPEQRRLLDTFARLIAISLERIHYVDVAQSTTVQMETERLRNSLLSAISHDLRTPLAALIGSTQALGIAQPQSTVQQSDIIKAIQDEAHRMNSLINNLLDMARLQSGSVKLNRQWQPLEEVIGSALHSVSTVMTRHPVQVQLPDDLPMLEIDAVLMERVFANLLENAAKYTPAGTPVVIGAALAGSRVDIWVDDKGPGLPAGREDDIFQKFERGHKERATSGVGLGLAICRAIVMAHGGSIRAENRTQGGARFIFSLPRGIPPSIDLEGDAMEEGQPS